MKKVYDGSLRMHLHHIMYLYHASSWYKQDGRLNIYYNSNDNSNMLVRASHALASDVVLIVLVVFMVTHCQRVDFGCLPFTKIRLESKWNTTLAAENFRVQRNTR